MHDNELLNLSPSRTAESRRQAHVASPPRDHVQYIKADPGHHQLGIIYGTRMHLRGNGYTRLCLAQTLCT